MVCSFLFVPGISTDAYPGRPVIAEGAAAHRVQFGVQPGRSSAQRSATQRASSKPDEPSGPQNRGAGGGASRRAGLQGLSADYFTLQRQGALDDGGPVDASW